MTQLSVKVQNVEIVRKGLEDLGREVPRVARLRIYRTMQKIQKRMRTPGAKINYPVKWDSEKQRRAFFATNGFGRGIPTHRTDSYSKGWNIERRESGYKMVNQVKYSQYIGGTAYGTNQSRIHEGRWPVLRNVADEETTSLAKEIDTDITMVARRKGF